MSSGKSFLAVASRALVCFCIYMLNNLLEHKQAGQAESFFYFFGSSPRVRGTVNLCDKL